MARSDGVGCSLTLPSKQQGGLQLQSAIQATGWLAASFDPDYRQAQCKEIRSCDSILLMKQYLDLVSHILTHGDKKEDRTGTGTLSVFGYQMRFNLQDGFPLVTTKKIHFNSVVHELLWFIKGATNIYDGLNPHTHIWDAWADEDGNLGPVYGHQWRNWHGIDQLKTVIQDIQSTPHSRRLIVSAWNVSDLDKMALAPCHCFFQFNVINGRLDCQLYQRSADVALGVPFNIASYALLTVMIAQECALIPGQFVHTLGDAHVYLNHIDGLREQLTRSPKPLPRIKIAKKPFFDIHYEDVLLEDYVHDPYIKFPIAV